MNALVSTQLHGARSFFLRAPRGLKAAADPDPQGAGNVPTMFQPNGNTTGGVMQFNGVLPDGVSDDERAVFAQLLKDQQFYLQSGLGLVTAWMTRNYQQDPAQWANPANWQSPLSNLPAEFYTPTEITQYTFQQHIRGVEIATSFLSTMIGWASGAGLAGSFTGFLQTLGDQIRLGTQSKQTSMDTYHLAFGYQPVLDSAGTWQLVSTADYYFVSFSQSEKTVYSNCASAEVFDFDFKYRKGTLLLNWANLSNEINQQNRKDWNDVITGSTRDDVTKSKNFFGGNVAKS
ncbi:hypothetical protein LDO32_08810 [Luteimonas sp. Y-2-2-4F]|nr:hypothetical protein [Luteimonas sp. Y-2-2-4F]MCD9031606.1 hypothetical protein [Luteimonas sp. Y-2-2-4F]MCD9031819.1 hypothetical protein [Luteimonas sp. Y-2-2-4F]